MAKGSLMDPVLASTPPQLRELGFGTLLEHCWSQISDRLVPSQVVPAATERLKLLQVRGSGQECLQVRVWISHGVRRSWGRTVRGLDWRQEKPVSPGPQPQKSKAKGSRIIPTLSQQNLPLAQLSDFSSKRARVFGGGSRAMPCFPPIMAEGGREVRSFCLV